MRTEGIWFDEVGTLDWERLTTIDLKPGGCNWRYPQEEKQVKQIDFSKPIENKTHEGSKVTVLQEGLTLIKSDGPNGVDFYAIDETGKSHLSNQSLHYGSMVRFENVPEEPKDHLQLWFHSGVGWELDEGLFTKAEAEAWVNERVHYQKRQAVKVPA